MKLDTKATRKKNLIYAGQVMLARLTEGIAMTDCRDFGAMKNAAACLKELRDLMFITPNLDEQEQSAKILSLQSKCAAAAPAGPVLVEFGDGVTDALG